MIDCDIYYIDRDVEMLINQLRSKLKQDSPSTKVYISTSNPYNNWLKKLYIIYNEDNKNE